MHKISFTKKISPLFPGGRTFFIFGLVEKTFVNLTT